jgi:hypothetical protein
MVPNARTLVVSGALVVLAAGGAEYATQRTQAIGTAATVTSATITTDVSASTATAAARVTTASTRSGQQINPDVLAGVRRSETTALAGALHLTPKALAKDRRNGQNITQIAQAQNIPIASVSASVLPAAKANLDQAASLGGVTPAAEQKELGRLSTQLAKQLSATAEVRHATRTTQSSNATTTSTNELTS